MLCVGRMQSATIYREWRIFRIIINYYYSTCVCACVCIVFLYAVASNVMFVMLCNTDQVYDDLPKYDDDNAVSGDLNDMQSGHKDWLQEYANY